MTAPLGWTNPRIDPAERRVLHSPAWLVPVDLLTGGPPAAAPTVVLERRRGSRWERVDRRPVITPSGAVTFPGLGFSANPRTAPATTYRVALALPRYVSLYRRSVDGLTFTAHPYNDTTPPAAVAIRQEVPLAPAVDYPFPARLPVLRGTVTAVDGTPVADTEVRATFADGLPEPRTEETVTDARGAFALPLRWARPGTTVTAKARHTRGPGPLRTGRVDVRVPLDLASPRTIVIT